MTKKGGPWWDRSSRTVNDKPVVCPMRWPHRQAPRRRSDDGIQDSSRCSRIGPRVCALSLGKNHRVSPMFRHCLPTIASLES